MKSNRWRRKAYRDLYHEHCRTEHVPCVVAPEFDPLVLKDLVVVYQLDLVDASVQILPAQTEKSPWNTDETSALTVGTAALHGTTSFPNYPSSKLGKKRLEIIVPNQDLECLFRIRESAAQIQFSRSGFGSFFSLLRDFPNVREFGTR